MLEVWDFQFDFLRGTILRIFKAFIIFEKWAKIFELKIKIDLTGKDKNKPKSDRWSQGSRKSSRYMQTTAAKRNHFIRVFTTCYKSFYNLLLFCDQDCPKLINCVTSFWRNLAHKHESECLSLRLTIFCLWVLCVHEQKRLKTTVKCGFVDQKVQCGKI